MNLPTNTKITNAYFFVFLGELLIVAQFIDAFRNANDVSTKINYRLAHLPDNEAIIIKKVYKVTSMYQWLGVVASSWVHILVKPRVLASTILSMANVLVEEAHVMGEYYLVRIFDGNILLRQRNVTHYSRSYTPKLDAPGCNKAMTYQMAMEESSCTPRRPSVRLQVNIQGWRQRVEPPDSDDLYCP